MALANFFDKAALGASQILNSFNREEFEGHLMKNKVGIAFDETAANSIEANATLDLLVRLTARLYPDLQIIDQKSKNSKLATELEECAKSINPQINLSRKTSPNICVVVGATRFENKNCKCLYIGSDGWLAKFSTNGPVGSGNSIIPFGAGAAACFGAANLFRTVFKHQLKKANCDESFAISLFDYSLTNIDAKDTGPSIDKVKLDPTLLVGIGAIGNATIWTLGQIKSLNGELQVIDAQNIDLSNLQRYVLSNQSHFNNQELKVSIAKKYLSKTKLKVIEQPSTWQEYIKSNHNVKLKKIAICVDSAQDRILVQASLPKKIFNAWTQPSSLGVSRHLNFIKYPCLMCLYIPDQKKKSRSEIISESLGIPQFERLVRGYLAMDKPIDRPILEIISTAKNIPIDTLVQYEGNSMEIFYSDLICGGTMLRLAPNSQYSEIEVPSPFESALAGILLAVEIIIDAGKLRNNELPTLARFNLLRPISKHILEIQHKHQSGRCICQDPIFIESYSRKWLEPLKI